MPMNRGCFQNLNVRKPQALSTSLKLDSLVSSPGRLPSIGAPEAGRRARTETPYMSSLAWLRSQKPLPFTLVKEAARQKQPCRKFLRGQNGERGKGRRGAHSIPLSGSPCQPLLTHPSETPSSHTTPTQTQRHASIRPLTISGPST